MEILELRERIDDLLQQNNKYFDEKNSLEKTVAAINDVRATQKSEINKLVDDNQKLVKLAQDNEKTIKNLELEKSNLISRNDEANFELKNTSNKLKMKEENLSYTIRQLDDMKLANIKLQNTLKDYEMQIDNLRNENSNLNANLQKEKMSRNESEKNGDRLENVIADRDREINRLIGELDDSKRNGNRLSDEKFVLESESQKLKNHIFILTEQNEKVGRDN
jgi:chromosome segregation ATPase